jgi:hypothetical protein
MLDKRRNPENKRTEYCLVSRDGKRVLEWYGVNPPSGETVIASEERIERWKKRKNKWTM